jgi:hypothetical protein
MAGNAKTERRRAIWPYLDDSGEGLGGLEEFARGLEKLLAVEKLRGVFGVIWVWLAACDVWVRQREGKPRIPIGD